MTTAKRWKNRLIFECPGCKYSHQILVDGPQAWQWNGDMEKPTITPSILVNQHKSNPSALVCHSYITDGKIQFLNDCEHELAGKTVDLPQLEKVME